MILGLGAEDRYVSRVVIHSDACLIIVTDGGCSKLLRFEEDPLTNAGRRGRGAGDMDVAVVKLACNTSDAGAIELIHKVNIRAGEVGVLGE